MCFVAREKKIKIKPFKQNKQENKKTRKQENKKRSLRVNSPVFHKHRETHAVLGIITAIVCVQERHILYREERKGEISWCCTYHVIAYYWRCNVNYASAGRINHPVRSLSAGFLRQNAKTRYDDDARVAESATTQKPSKPWWRRAGRLSDRVARVGVGLKNRVKAGWRSRAVEGCFGVLGCLILHPVSRARHLA